MDVEAGKLRLFTKESIAIPKQSPKTLYLVTLTLIFPLSFAILAHFLLFTHPILTHAASKDRSTFRVFQFFYLLFFFASSLMSTAAVVFNVVSLYSSKPFSFLSTISTIPRVFKRIFITFPWVSLTMMVVYNIVFFGILALLNVTANKQNNISVVFNLVADFFGVYTRIVVGGFLVALLVIVNLMGLLMQSMFYYVHHQGIIDKSALYDNLGGYLEECLPL